VGSASLVPPRVLTVQNQPPPLLDYNLFDQDQVLRQAVEREGGAWGLAGLSRFGGDVGGEPLRLGTLADGNPPVFRPSGHGGRPVAEIEFHPAWTALLDMGIRAGIPSMPWRDPRPGAHVVRAASFFLLSQAEAGVMCPLSMTYASIPTLRHAPGLAEAWEPRLLDSDPGRSALCGMAMTEKQGGSDVRTNTTQARPAGGGRYELTGHKWFCSHPACDAFLVLAQAPEGLSCFLLPRLLPDGSPNEGFRVVRLKDKLGTRALASAEVEFEAASAWLVGAEGAGVRTILDMVNHTRLDCVLGSAAGMRRAVAEATHYAAHRSAFGRLLSDQPLMMNVLADLCVESEAATLLALRLAAAYEPGADPGFRRLATAVAKYWVCKRTTPLVVEAMESLGGNGFVEDQPMARLLRDSPLNSIWEGSGNVIALDVLRTFSKDPESFEILMAELDLAAGVDSRLDRHLDGARAGVPVLASGEEREAQYLARRIVGGLGLLLQASLLVRYSPPHVIEAFLASRLAYETDRTFGTLPAGIDCQAIIERHRPKLAGG
jgi:putative acyl-CoA dehydrogenase